MTGNRKDDREAFGRLMAAIVDDILDASEDELAAELLEEGRTPTEEAEAMRAVIDHAARQCGKARLKAAKEALESAHASQARNIGQLSAAEARRRLANLLEQKSLSGGLSLAARKETEMSDSDVFGMLADLEELEAKSEEDISGSDS